MEYRLASSARYRSKVAPWADARLWVHRAKAWEADVWFLAVAHPRAV